MTKKAEPAPKAPPSAPVAAPSPTQAAPVPTAPAPEVHTGPPEQYKMSGGRHAGKTLGEIVAADRKYVEYLRANGSDLQKQLAGKVLDAKPPMPEPVKDAPAPAPVAGQAAAPATGVVDQKALVAECKTMMKNIPEFQGVGIAKAWIPFLRSIGGAKFDYTEWTVDQLVTLKSKLTEKLATR